MKPKVYISIGSAATTIQKQAADTIFRSLETAGLSPRQMERNEWTAEQPLRGIKKVIEQCQGIVVIAFRRYQFSTGTERQKDGSEKQLANIRITTVWNQIEAAMGYTRGLPLLVIAEEGLLEDGLLEGCYDWKVYWTDFSLEQLQSDKFVGYLESWKELVLEQNAVFPPPPPPLPTPTPSPSPSPSPSKEDVDISKLTWGRFLGMFTFPQLWGAISVVFGCLSAVAYVSYRAGLHHWLPW